jgi:hypothetical protein
MGVCVALPYNAHRGASPAGHVVIAGVVLCAAVLVTSAQAHAVPSPEQDYLYNVTVRRHYDFPENDAIGYGRGICDKVGAGQSYAAVMDAAAREVRPGDRYSANFLVSYAVSQFCPEQIWQLRQSAAGYQAPEGTSSPVGGLQGDVAGK